MDQVRTDLYSALATYALTNPLTSQNIQAFLGQFKASSSVSPIHLQTLTLDELKHAHHGKTVTFRLMVQDIMDHEYYLGAMVASNPPADASIETKVVINKYWNGVHDAGIVSDEDYEHVILERESYHCIPIKGQTAWVKSINGDKGHIKQVVLKVFDNANLKIGSVVHGVGIVDFEDSLINAPSEPFEGGAMQFQQFSHLDNLYNSPKIPRINVLRFLTEEQVRVAKLDVPKLYLEEPLSHDFQFIRAELIGLFNKFSSEVYSELLLYSLIGTNKYNIFLNGDNLSYLLQKLLPYFVEVKIKLPFKVSTLFPHKLGAIKEAQLQICGTEHTYVILDFSQMGSGKVDISGQDVQGFACMKKLVEDGELVYRWEMGESAFKVSCSGIIAKGANLIKPTHFVKEHQIDLQKVTQVADSLTDEQLRVIRAYVLQCRARLEEVDLSGDEMTKIEQDFVQERQDCHNQSKQLLSPEQFHRRLVVAKLNSCSRGQQIVHYQQYLDAKKLIG